MPSQTRRNTSHIKLLATLFAMLQATTTTTILVQRTYPIPTSTSPRPPTTAVTTSRYNHHAHFNPRQEFSCERDHHNCLDINHPAVCCRNDEYCYIAPDAAPSCCPLGSLCKSICAAHEFQCQDIPNPSDPLPPEVSRAVCCPRQCQSSSFLCSGGRCCAYGETCGSGGCVPTPTSTTTQSTRGGECHPTTQTACSDGGCCAVGMSCTQTSGLALCAESSTTPPSDDNGNGGLSPAASAGIGIGIAVFVILCVFAWMCTRRRTSRPENPLGRMTVSSISIDVSRQPSVRTMPASLPSRHTPTSVLLGQRHRPVRKPYLWSRSVGTTLTPEGSPLPLQSTTAIVNQDASSLQPGFSQGGDDNNDNDNGYEERKTYSGHRAQVWPVPGQPEGPNDITQACEMDATPARSRVD